MEIKWNLITDLKIVNNLLKIILRDKRTYEVRINSAEVRTENSAEDNSENSDEMVDVQSQLIVSTDRIATLVPDSRKYKEESINFNKLQARKIQLELDGETVGEQAIAVRIYNLLKTKALLDLATAAETAGLARKTALGG